MSLVSDATVLISLTAMGLGADREAERVEWIFCTCSGVVDEDKAEVDPRRPKDIRDMYNPQGFRLAYEIQKLMYAPHSLHSPLPFTAGSLTRLIFLNSLLHHISPSPSPRHPITARTVTSILSFNFLYESISTVSPSSHSLPVCWAIIVDKGRGTGSEEGEEFLVFRPSSGRQQSFSIPPDGRGWI